jgi:hypothetical protein
VDSFAPYSIQVFTKDEPLVFEDESQFNDANLLPPVKDIEDTHSSLNAGVVSVLFKYVRKISI